MYPILQTENWSNFAKDSELKPFCPNFNDLYLFKYRISHWKRGWFGISIKFYIQFKLYYTIQKQIFVTYVNIWLNLKCTKYKTVPLVANQFFLV